MTRDRKLKQESGQVNFTEDIWAKIAGHFTTKEWAAVAGVCKTTWNLPFNCAKLDYKLPREGISLLIACAKPRIVTGLASTSLEDCARCSSCVQASILVAQYFWHDRARVASQGGTSF